MEVVALLIVLVETAVMMVVEELVEVVKLDFTVMTPILVRKVVSMIAPRQTLINALLLVNGFSNVLTVTLIVVMNGVMMLIVL